MSREWKPGTVLADNLGRVFYAIEVTANSIAAGRSGQAWREGSHVIEANGNGWRPQDFHGLRPLVVIDPEDREAVERLVKVLSTGQPLVGLDPTNRGVVDAAWIKNTQAALREYANPKPPRPGEPQGLGAVVEDEDGQKWTRANDEGEWFSQSGRDVAITYDEFNAVRVLSPGVEVDQ